MSIVVNSLPAYVEEHRLPLIHAAVLGAKTAKMINRQSGVKGKAALNLVATTPVLQDGSACSWNAQGDASLTQRVLETKPVSVMMEFCDKSLLGKWAEYQVRLAAGEKELPFEEDFMNDIAANINAEVEKIIWQGDSALGISGLADVLGDGAISAEIAEGSTAYAAIKAVYMTIPAAVLKKAKIFVGEDTYRAFVMECMEKNLFHYSGADGAETYKFPGTNTEVVAVPGLNGTNAIIAADPDNLFYGYDVEDAQEVFDVWYSKDDKVFKLNVEFNMGVQVAYPGEVVAGQIA